MGNQDETFMSYWLTSNYRYNNQQYEASNFLREVSFALHQLTNACFTAFSLKLSYPSY